MGAPTIFRTDLTEYLMDLLDFVEEKIKEAQNDHASRAGALSEAMGAFPIIKDRLYREDKKTLTQLLLIGFFDEDLMQLATLPNGEIIKKTDDVCEHLSVIRSILERRITGA